MMRFLIMVMLVLVFVLPASAQWGHIDSPFHGEVTGFEVLPSGGILVGTSGGLFASVDGGESWFFTGLGSLDDASLNNDGVFDAWEHNGTVYVVMRNLYYSSTDLNDFQRQILPGWVYALTSVVTVNDMIVVASEKRIWRSADDDLPNFVETFEVVSDDDEILALLVDPYTNNILAQLSTLSGNYFLVSDDEGATWTEQLIADVPGQLIRPQFGEDGDLYFGNNYISQGHLRSTSDYGATSTEFYTAPDNVRLDQLTLGFLDRMAVLQDPGVLVSTNGGGSFDGPYDAMGMPSALMFNGTDMLAGNSHGIYISDDDGSSWPQFNTGLMVHELMDADIDSDGNTWLLNDSRLYRQDGASWDQFELPADGNLESTVFGISNTGRLFQFGRNTATDLESGYYSDDDGDTWTEVSGMGIESNYRFSRFQESVDGRLFAGHEGLGPFVSEDDGLTWEQVNENAPGQFAISGDLTMYSAQWDSLRVSTDNGETWFVDERIPTPFIVEASPANGTVLVLSHTDLVRYNPASDNWSNITNRLDLALTDAWVEYISGFAFTPSGDIYVTVVIEDFGTYRNFTRVLKSVDNGLTFTDETSWSYLNGASVDRVKRTREGMIIAMTNMGLFGEDTFLSVDDEPIVAMQPLPQTITLAQNYPNPFNAATTIPYTLVRPGHASLVVYDILGREVVRLVDGVHSAGTQQVLFDGSRLSSGVYFYRLTADGQSVAKRMVLVK